MKSNILSSILLIQLCMLLYPSTLVSTHAFSINDNKSNQNIAFNSRHVLHNNNRRNFLQTIIVGTSSAIVVGSPLPGNALVKGNAPPPKKKASSEERKCTNVEECQEMAERYVNIKTQYIITFTTSYYGHDVTTLS